MSTIPAPRRHALGMPAGSIRALLGLSVLASLWVMAIANPDKVPTVFVYLTILKLFILVHYFASHGKTAGLTVSHKHALGLPRGTIRLVLMGGFAGLLTFMWKHQTEIVMPKDGLRFYLLIGLLLGGFFLGYVLTKLFRSSSGDLPAWYQDIQAWLALIAAIGLMVVAIIYGVINASVEEDRQLTIEQIEAGLAGLIGLYFGARS